MPKSLEGASILLVEDDADNRELVELFLQAEGAEVRSTASVAAATDVLAGWVPDLVLTDMTLPDGDGFDLLAALRAIEGGTHIPAIAVTGLTDRASRERAVAAGFTKFVTKPFDIFALLTAVVSATRIPRDAPSATSAIPGLDADNLGRLIASKDMRGLLAALNAVTGYRYTSILRFVDGRLESLWTFDRIRQSADSFPADAPIEASYCSFVARTLEPFAITDALLDERVRNHPQRESLRAYCGVPLFRQDGALFGTLCHYDEQAHPVESGVVEGMENVARMLSSVLPPADAPLPLPLPLPLR